MRLREGEAEARGGPRRRRDTAAAGGARDTPRGVIAVLLGEMLGVAEATGAAGKPWFGERRKEERDDEWGPCVSNRT